MTQGTRVFVTDALEEREVTAEINERDRRIEELETKLLLVSRERNEWGDRVIKAEQSGLKAGLIARSRQNALIALVSAVELLLRESGLNETDEDVDVGLVVALNDARQHTGTHVHTSFCVDGMDWPDCLKRARSEE